MRAQFALAALALVALISAQSPRLQCLQHLHQLGRLLPSPSPQWARSFPSTTSTSPSNSSKTSPGHWVFQAPNCPLRDFNTELFCRDAVGCGKKVLLVGDSTLKAWMVTIKRMLGDGDCSEVRSNPCPANNTPSCVRAPPTPSHPHHAHCDPTTHWGTDSFIYEMNACGGVCPKRSGGVLITFVRHDFLNNVHGRRWYKDAVCHHWWDVVMEYDYLVLSFGPHLGAVIDNPFTTSRSRHNTVEELFQFTASVFTERLARLFTSSNSSKIPQVLYRTGPVGVSNYSRNCDEPPLEYVPDIANAYDWPLIPMVNEIYVKSMLKSFSFFSPSATIPIPVLIMDTSMLMSQIKSCRADFMHFRLDDLSSPVGLEIQIFFNILLEYKRTSFAHQGNFNNRFKTFTGSQSYNSIFIRILNVIFFSVCACAIVRFLCRIFL